MTGDTKVVTTEGLRSFKELADLNEDVQVYCLNEKGQVVISKMLHPRITGYNMDIVEIVLDDGSRFKVTENHQFLTQNGYDTAGDLLVGEDSIMSFEIPDGCEIPDEIKEYIEFTGTKKGTVIKKCEVTGNDFECAWDERETSSSPSYDTALYKKMKEMWNLISESASGNLHTIVGGDFLEKTENVYNGTVAVYHNYFIMDEKTGTMVNQLNCGE